MGTGERTQISERDTERLLEETGGIRELSLPEGSWGESSQRGWSAMPNARLGHRAQTFDSVIWRSAMFC